LPWNSDAYDSDFFTKRPCCKYTCTTSAHFAEPDLTTFDSKNYGLGKRSNAEIFLYKSVIGYWNDNCKPFETGDETLYSSYALGYTFLVWVVVFFCIF